MSQHNFTGEHCDVSAYSNDNEIKRNVKIVSGATIFIKITRILYFNHEPIFLYRD